MYGVSNAKSWYTEHVGGSVPGRDGDQIMTTTTEFEVHKTTGLPIQPTATFEVGDLVTEGINSDGYPGVVVHATAKTVYVAHVSFQGSFSPNDLPGYNGYGDSGTIAIDPESVEQAIAAGMDGAVTKYVLYTARKAHPAGSINDREKYGEAGFHRSRWQRPGGYGHVSHGASYRQDPHF